jgi:hypothetical protein
MKTSLVIPCTPEHFLSLLTILHFYQLGTIKPDEVVVSLSNSQLVSSVTKSYVKNKALEMFDNFILLEHTRKVTHGPNRQAASEASTGDLIIYTDADDIPHFKRVETIKHFFMNYDVLHINHWFCKEEATFTDFLFSDVEFVSPEQIDDYYFSDCNLREIQFKKPGGYGSSFGRTGGGSLSIHRKVLERVRWKDWSELFGPGEDWEFCFETAYTFRKSMILKLDLIKYISDSARNFPSSVYEKITPGAKW